MNLFASEYIVRFGFRNVDIKDFTKTNGGKLEKITEGSNLYLWDNSAPLNRKAMEKAGIIQIQPNRKITLYSNPSMFALQKAFIEYKKKKGLGLEELLEPAPKDNPEILTPTSASSGADPLLKGSWGMFKIGADISWNKTSQGKDIIVAVTDSGVDYNHPDLVSNMWRNSKEIPGNGIDDDGNGYVDDIVGWDFYSNDNKPYDLKATILEMLMGGGNPGHGTHVSGVIASTKDNGIGVAGVAPQVQIMALRFLSEKGQGDTAGGIKAIDYAVANGARVINASWGSEGEEKGDFALRDAIKRAEAKGVIFCAAAGNGRADMSKGKAFGYDNDNDPKPSYPATYNYSNMITVAALGENDELAEFSNWGQKSVHIGAPGVKILSTVPNGKYQDTVLDLTPMLAMKATWDGTSMATPFVSGAVAMLMSQNRNLTSDQVKDLLLSKVVPVAALSSKIVTGGRLDISKLY
jgi:subtilisin family serine protease